MDAGDLQQAVISSRSVLASVQPEQMDHPTPCRSWQVRDLINHMIGAPIFAAVVMETGDWRNQTGDSADHAAGDYLAAYDAATARAIRSFQAEGALSRLVKLPFADLPGAVYASIATGDAFAHGWDLAKATGRSTDLDPDLAERLLAAVRPLLPEQMRGPDGQSPFGPEVAVPEDAPAADRLAGFLGRQP
jgi:uncharacterized protein (TIGR03086 family)